MSATVVPKSFVVPSPPPAPEYVFPNLTHADRCDTRDCSAQAYVRVVSPAGSDLLFCGHHLTTHEESLSNTGFLILEDTRHLLTARPTYTD